MQKDFAEVEEVRGYLRDIFSGIGDDFSSKVLGINELLASHIEDSLGMADSYYEELFEGYRKVAEAHKKGTIDIYEAAFLVSALADSAYLKRYAEMHRKESIANECEDLAYELVKASRKSLEEKPTKLLFYYAFEEIPNLLRDINEGYATPGRVRAARVTLQALYKGD